MRILLTVGMALMGTAAMAEPLMEPRCGRDDFGNVVCMDAHGVLHIGPGRTQDAESFESAGVEAGTTEDEAGNRRAEAQTGIQVRRCGMDPFGNQVCR